MGVLVRLIMASWERMIQESLRKVGVDIYLTGIYIDDENFATAIIGKGWSWMVHKEGGRTLEFTERRSGEKPS